MGSGSSVPAWVGDIVIVERTGWTERQLYEDNSLEFIQRMNYLNEMRVKADALKGRGGGSGRGGRADGLVKEFEFQA